MKVEHSPFKSENPAQRHQNRRCVGVAVRFNSGEQTVRKCSSLLGIQSQLSFKVIRSAQSLGICLLLHTRAITLNSWPVKWPHVHPPLSLPSSKELQLLPQDAPYPYLWGPTTFQVWHGTLSSYKDITSLQLGHPKQHAIKGLILCSTT